VILVYIPCPSAEAADALAAQLLAEGLIACANRLAPVQAHFMWDGAVQAAEEHPVLLKVPPGLAEAACARAEALHPYDVPAILRWEVAANAGFARWAEACTAPNER
jgi:periplasmic divalent cation tolerance protein